VAFAKVTPDFLLAESLRNWFLNEVMSRVQLQSSESYDSPLDPAERSALIKSQALQLGFHKVGLVSAEPLINELGRLREWLRRGFHGEMNWMARDPEQRTDPRKVFAGVCSVVQVGVRLQF
jgi:hypothetical protein